MYFIYAGPIKSLIVTNALAFIVFFGVWLFIKWRRFFPRESRRVAVEAPREKRKAVFFYFKELSGGLGRVEDVLSLFSPFCCVGDVIVLFRVPDMAILKFLCDFCDNSIIIVNFVNNLFQVFCVKLFFCVFL